MVKKTKITVAGRNYEILEFPGSNKKIVNLDVMLNKAKRKNAVLTRSNFRHLFIYQNEIPDFLLPRTMFALVGDQPNDNFVEMFGFWWTPAEGWVNYRLSPNFDTNGSYHFIRCKA